MTHRAPSRTQTRIVNVRQKFARSYEAWPGCASYRSIARNRNPRAGSLSAEIDTTALTDLLAWVGKPDITEGKSLKELIGWTEFEHALRKQKIGKGVGCDGFDAYLLRRADVEVQPYAFTTKSLYVGDMDYKYLRWQVPSP